MGDNKIRGLNQRIQRCNIDLATSDHIVGDAGQPCDFRRDRLRWLAQATVDADDIPGR